MVPAYHPVESVLIRDRKLGCGRGARCVSHDPVIVSLSSVTLCYRLCRFFVLSVLCVTVSPAARESVSRVAESRRSRSRQRRTVTAHRRAEVRRVFAKYREKKINETYPCPNAFLITVNACIH